MPAKARRTFRTIGSASVLWNPPALAAAAASTITAGVPGAKPGDSVIVTPLVQTTGLVYSAHVSAASVVTVRAQNVTATSVDAGPTAFAVLVLRP